jgi:hypothetical protein
MWTLFLSSFINFCFASNLLLSFLCFFNFLAFWPFPWQVTIQPGSMHDVHIFPFILDHYKSYATSQQNSSNVLMWTELLIIIADNGLSLSPSCQDVYILVHIDVSYSCSNPQRCVISLVPNIDTLAPNQINPFWFLMMRELHQVKSKAGQICNKEKIKSCPYWFYIQMYNNGREKISAFEMTMWERTQDFSGLMDNQESWIWFIWEIHRNNLFIYQQKYGNFFSSKDYMLFSNKDYN